MSKATKLPDGATAHYWSGRFRVPLDTEDLWNWHCFESGALGIETLAEGSAGVEVRVFFGAEGSEALQTLEAGFRSQFAQTVEELEILHPPIEDWQANWREHFRPVEVGETLTIAPPWCAEEIPPSRLGILIDPGLGFGTGTHATTVLTLRFIEQHLHSLTEPPPRMLDIGTGSGILSLAALRLGVAQAEGVELLDDAVENAKANAELNGLSGRFRVTCGGADALTQSAPLVVANMILAELRAVLADLVRLTAPGGTLICSGLLAGQLKEWQDELAGHGFHAIADAEQEGWAAVVFQKEEEG